MGLFPRKRGGLFGAPMSSTDTPPYSTGYGHDPSAGTVSASPAAATLAPSTAPPFQGKRNFLDKLGLVADAFSNNNNNAQQLAFRDQQEYQQTQMSQKQYAPQQIGNRIVRLNPQTGQYESLYEAPQTQADDQFTRTLAAAGIDPASDEAKALYRQRASTLASPAPNFVSDGMGGGRWLQPPAPSMGGAAPQRPVGKLTPIGGGAAPSGPRTFPVR